MANLKSKDVIAKRQQEANLFYESGRYSEAKAIYKELIEHQDAHAETCHYLSLIALTEGDMDAALSYASQAQKVDINNLNYILNLGELNRRMGDLSNALIWVQRAVKNSPQDATTYYNLGSVYLDFQDYLSAQDAFSEAIRLQPNHGLAWNNLGSVYQQRGLLDLAYEAYSMAVQINPRHAEAQCNKGFVLFQRQNYQAARICMELALQSRPSFLEAKNNLKHIIDPMGGSLFLEALANLALDFQNQQQHQAVIELLQTEVGQEKSSPEMSHLWHLLGISYYRLNQFADAYECYQTTIAMAPRFAGALNSLGFLLQDMRLYTDAKLAFEDAIQLDPNFDMARLNLGLIQLKLGLWEEGWSNYEYRWTGSAETINQAQLKPDVPLILWNGIRSSGNKSILVLAEQGFGDTIQFCRYMDLLKDRFEKVSLYVPDPLRRLMEWSFEKDVEIISSLPNRFEAWTSHIPLLSLPRVLHTTLDQIPSTLPYLQVPGIFREFWERRLLQKGVGRLKIGVAWSGRKSLQYDARRSIAFTQFASLLGIDGVDWICLQKWDQDIDLTLVNPNNWFDWTAELNDFADTAALIDNLDLVVTVDSAVAHLAGALNKPVYLLNRYDGEWRWLCNQERSPWYPSMEIFNQPEFGKWDPAIEAIKQRIIGLTRDRLRDS